MENQDINVTGSNTGEQENISTVLDAVSDEKILTYTQSEMIEKMTKEKNAGRRAILNKLGFKHEKELDNILSEFNNYREAKKNNETDADKLKALSESFNELSEKYKSSLSDLESLKCEKILRRQGIIDDEEIELYTIRINKFVNEDIDFESAAKEYFKKNPRKKPPEFNATTKKAAATPSSNLNKLINDAIARKRGR